MDNLSLGYTFRGLSQARQVRIVGTIQNVFTITDYTGVDPEAGINGIDNTIYPRSRTFTFGTNIAF
jgi:iron complex outermembrane receptor protein